uniref:Purple acid phosphatase n=1 Tax=Rhabditophanes sp. KR3021 TaxID=114890 RepID=A0AC35TWZ9_9BILA
MSLLTVILIIFFSTLIYSKHHTSRNGSIHEQVHLSLTKDARSMMVTWITFEQIQAGFPLVKYGKNKSNFDEVQTGYTTKFVDKIGTITRFVHRVNLTELAFGTRYYYKVGFNESWSETTYSFATFPEGSDFGVKLCVYGDLGYNEKVTMDALIRDVRNGRCQLIVHLGDIAYSLHYDDGKIGDEFMRAMEPAISSVPFMTSPGNHEFSCFGFDHYDNRFTMPVKDKISDVDSYYSFTLGPINFFAISSEVYGHVAVYGNDPIRRQAWQLEDDLKQAEARKSDKPWKIGYQHRPLYCFQEYYDQECNDYENKIMRSGYEDIPGLEILYQKYELNLLLMGHEHVYERLWPIYNRTIYKYPENKYFKNSPAPVHILTGAGGCDCTHQTSIELGPFSVKRSSGVIIYDNALWDGKVIDHNANDADTNAIRAINDVVFKDPNCSNMLFNVGDGIHICFKN